MIYLAVDFSFSAVVLPSLVSSVLQFGLLCPSPQFSRQLDGRGGSLKALPMRLPKLRFSFGVFPYRSCTDPSSVCQADAVLVGIPRALEVFVACCTSCSAVINFSIASPLRRYQRSEFCHLFKVPVIFCNNVVVRRCFLIVSLFACFPRIVTASGDGCI